MVLERNGCSEFASGIAEQLVCAGHVEQVRTCAESRRRRDQSVATALRDCDGHCREADALPRARGLVERRALPRWRRRPPRYAAVVIQRLRKRAKRLTLYALALAMGAALSFAATATAAATLPRLLTEEFGSFRVRPTQMTLSEDGSLIIAGNAAWIGRNPSPQTPGSQFGHIVWTSWTATQATGSGVEWLDNCKPNCAQGTYFPQTVELAASRPAAGVYSRLILRFTDGARTERLTLKHLNPGPNGYVWS